jgi:hypothetical protein
MRSRTIEDRLREEYFDLLPEIRRVAEYIEAVTKYHLLAISGNLRKFEQIIVRCRVKECESAVEALRRRQEGAIFDPDKDEGYTLKTLKDLAGVRVLAFPHGRLEEINTALQEPFAGWTPDPVLDEDGKQLALKYWGHCPASQSVTGEYQIVPMLTGLFWEVEHSAIYKPSPELRGITRSLEMRGPIADVLEALRRFEETFETLVRQAAK